MHGLSFHPHEMSDVRDALASASLHGHPGLYFCQTVVEVSKQPVLRQGRQGTQHAAKEDVTTGFKAGRCPVEKTDCRQDAFVRPCARRPQFGYGIKGGPRGLVGGSRLLWTRCIFGYWLTGCLGTRPDQSSLPNRLAERVWLEAQLLGDLP